MNLVLVVALWAASQNIVSINPKYPDVPQDVKKSTNQASAITRFNAEAERAGLSIDSCQEDQRKLVNVIRASKTDYPPVLYDRAIAVGKLCQVPLGKVGYLGKIARLDARLLQRKQIDALKDLVSRLKEVSITTEYIAQILQQKVHPPE